MYKDRSGGVLAIILRHTCYPNPALRARRRATGPTERTVDAQAGRFEQTVDAQAGRAEAMAVQVTGSAVELSSLGEALHLAVGRFSEANEKLIDGLQRVEDAVGTSMARSDEQLAYYVAQAREIIDLSLSSQKDVLDALSRASAKPALAAPESA